MVVPTYMPLSYGEFARHFRHVVSPDRQREPGEGPPVLFGYSCRALFATLLQVLRQVHGRKLRLVSTPIHHSSWKELMEEHGEDIHVLHLSPDFRAIEITDEDEQAIEDADAVVVTHLFGRSFDLKELETLARKHGVLSIADCVLECASAPVTFDINFYSTGHDKRPVAVGGGYAVFHSESSRELRIAMQDQMEGYPAETRFKRALKLTNIFFLWHLYSSRPIHHLVFALCKATNTPLSDVIGFFRRTNPGFEQKKYMFRPSDALLSSMSSVLATNMYSRISEKYASLWARYLSLLEPEKKALFYPYYQDEDEDICMPYNQIRIPRHRVKAFIAHCDRHLVGAIENQNYDALTEAPEEAHVYMAEMVNLASVASCPVEKLASVVNSFPLE